MQLFLCRHDTTDKNPENGLEVKMRLSKLIRAVGILVLAAAWPSWAAAQAKPPHAFNVLNQRTIALTAEYWNPIITYVSKKSGVPLQLKLAKNAREGNMIAEKGGYDFLYTNHFFTPERDVLGFQVIARPVGPGIQAQIVVPSDSPIRSLQDLEGKSVGFVSQDAFAGYMVPYDALLRAKVNVQVSFTGNQEASVAQLKVGKLEAAGLNGLILERYARREGFAYRALWTSPVYPDLCIMAHKRVPADDVTAVRAALVGMDKDPEGRKILEASAALIKATGAVGFVPSEDRDYDGYRTFFKTTQVKRH
jgi:phosphonate transport system substrate-binding protein